MESSKSGKIKIPLTDEEQYLVDRDKYIYDLVLSFDLFEFHQLAMQHFRGLVDFYHAWESNLSKFIIPHTNNFLEFITWCASSYIPFKGLSFPRMGYFYW
jgi:hypothetical protein